MLWNEFLLSDDLRRIDSVMVWKMRRRGKPLLRVGAEYRRGGINGQVRRRRGSNKKLRRRKMIIINRMNIIRRIILIEIIHLRDQMRGDVKNRNGLLIGLNIGLVLNIILIVDAAVAMISTAEIQFLIFQFDESVFV